MSRRRLQPAALRRDGAARAAVFLACQQRFAGATTEPSDTTAQSPVTGAGSSRIQRPGASTGVVRTVMGSVPPLVPR